MIDGSVHTLDPVDVVVIGAGPGGASTGLTDNKWIVRLFCGDFWSPDNEVNQILLAQPELATFAPLIESWNVPSTDRKGPSAAADMRSSPCEHSHPCCLSLKQQDITDTVVPACSHEADDMYHRSFGKYLHSERTRCHVPLSESGRHAVPVVSGRRQLRSTELRDLTLCACAAVESGDEAVGVDDADNQ
jgi:hypothetical protein